MLGADDKPAIDGLGDDFLKRNTVCALHYRQDVHHSPGHTVRLLTHRVQHDWIVCHVLFTSCLSLWIRGGER